ncbi:hypothetical protein ALO58_200168 [Pseudomonas savastanoi pv. savastanoi]|nr:hypothetical protein ALO58_200168 [Pseudomonas savastanoi pv. savastanoi]
MIAGRGHFDCRPLHLCMNLIEPSIRSLAKMIVAVCEPAFFLSTSAVRYALLDKASKTRRPVFLLVSAQQEWATNCTEDCHPCSIAPRPPTSAFFLQRHQGIV